MIILTDVVIAKLYNKARVMKFKKNSFIIEDIDVYCPRLLSLIVLCLEQEKCRDSHIVENVAELLQKQADNLLFTTRHLV